MKLIPKYRISYKGMFYENGEAIEIDSKDMDSMKRHGKIVEEEPRVHPSVPTSSIPTRKPGRPPKR